jgi:hypothetical protein
LLEERLGLAVLPLADIEPGQIVQAVCDVRMIGAQRLLIDPQRLL